MREKRKPSSTGRCRWRLSGFGLDGAETGWIRSGRSGEWNGGAGEKTGRVEQGGEVSPARHGHHHLSRQYQPRQYQPGNGWPELSWMSKGAMPSWRPRRPPPTKEGRDEEQSCMVEN